MNAYTDFDIENVLGWQSLDHTQTLMGYSIKETPHRFSIERMTETAGNWFAVVAMATGYLLFLLFPAPEAFGTGLMAKALFLMPFWMSSLVVYAFVSRGFQRALKLNLPKREMLIAKRNAAGQIRIARTVKFSEIESAFVRRKGTGATLHLRLKSFPPEICILSGRQDEIEALHRRLCRDLRFAQAV